MSFCISVQHGKSSGSDGEQRCGLTWTWSSESRGAAGWRRISPPSQPQQIRRLFRFLSALPFSLLSDCSAQRDRPFPTAPSLRPKTAPARRRPRCRACPWAACGWSRWSRWASWSKVWTAAASGGAGQTDRKDDGGKGESQGSAFWNKSWGKKSSNSHTFLQHCEHTGL